ncbi:hypothetical protein BBJ28_00026656 [Nothophytophthora sp. Chile5]|nr:hypothetical protein BBJ28_00026656 [Nothophytophthora sp. Chile5]
MLISLVLTPLAYLVPILPVIALGQPNWTTWNGTGSLYSAAKYLGGSIYTIWVTVVALLSASGLYIVGLLGNAYLACGMAEKGFAPVSLRFMGLARPNSHGIDHSVIFCSLTIILIVVNLELDDMVLITNALVGLETMVLIGAAVRLRVTRRDLPRPTKLCGKAHPLVMAAALVIPFAVSGFVVGWAFTKLIPSVLTGIFLFSGVVYGLQAGTTKGFHHTYESVRTRVTTTAT